MTDSTDYYMVLGVPRDADAAEIKKAYRKKAFELHPDRNSGDSLASKKFAMLSEAYACLSNSYKRMEYDALQSSVAGVGWPHGTMKSALDQFLEAAARTGEVEFEFNGMKIRMRMFKQ